MSVPSPNDPTALPERQRPSPFGDYASVDSRTRLAAIVESSQDAIISKTLDGIVVTWNRAAERIFGYTADEMIGQPITRLLPEDKRDDLAAIISAIRRGQHVDHFETERIRKDGERVCVSLTVSPIYDAQGRIVGASKIARDVTERRRIEREREELLRITELAREAAEKSDRAKDQFLAMLAHELRNPLAALHNAIIAAQLDGAKRERALDIARRQADHLGRLIDDLLDVARFTRGLVALDLETVALVEVVDRAVETIAPLLEERHHRLEVSVDSPLLMVEGDLARLKQVVENLLSNAAKYTPPGGNVELRVERVGEEAVITVKDSGIGIDATMLPHVFDLFSQGARELDRKAGGLGIGLTVVQRIVELHGGEVAVSSDGIGLGSEFRVRLPALPAAEPAAAADPEEAPPPAAGASILLVEDNLDAASSLKMLLELHGHRVALSHDGETAIRLAEVDVPDLMLIDIGLPIIDGYEVARRLRQHATLRNVFMVALTGYGRDEDRDRALRAGFDRHLVKPADPDDINEIARLSREARAPRPA